MSTTTKYCQESKSDIKIALILAHPDDESFIPSGTIAKYSQQGVKIIYLCATHGEAGHDGLLDKDLPAKRVKQIRLKELKNACNTLGISNLFVFDYPDGHLREMDPSQPIKELVRFLRSYQPEIIITFDPTGITHHTDHITINKWVTQAYYLSANPFYITKDEGPYTPLKLYYLTVPSNHLISISDSKERKQYIDSKISTVIDVSNFLNKKRKAIECHHSQCVNISKIFKFAGGMDEIDKYEYFILAACQIPNYSYEIKEDNLLSGLD